MTLETTDPLGRNPSKDQVPKMHDTTIFFCLETPDPGVEIQIPDDLLGENGWVIGPQG
jgi:hypothetical protein